MRREIELIYHDLSISSPSVCVTVFFWHRAGPVILESILPIHILNQARLFGKADLTGFSRKKIVRTWYH